jgi:hypothetical protein
VLKNVLSWLHISFKVNFSARAVTKPNGVIVIAKPSLQRDVHVRSFQPSRIMSGQTVSCVCCPQESRWVQEVIEWLATKVWGQRDDETLANLFLGERTFFQRCLNVDFSRKQQEVFGHIRFDLKFGNVKAALDELVQVHPLKVFEAEGHGKQNAECGVRFTKFPPVLAIHLQRLTVDGESISFTKNSQRFEFPTRLDLGPYLVQDKHPSQPTEAGGARRPRGGRPSVCTRCSCTAGVLLAGITTRTSGRPRGASGSGTGARLWGRRHGGG